MKRLLTVAILLIAGFSCKKDHKDEPYLNICFQAKYIGTGCWDMVEIISPQDKLQGYYTTFDFKNSNGTTVTYNHAIALDQLPQEFRNGNTFYFNISELQPAPAHTANCYYSAYLVKAGNVSASGCK